MSKWIRVTRAEPCPVCEKPDYCTRSSDGAVVRCMRVESEKTSKAGGWIHLLSAPLPKREAPPEPKRLASKEIGAKAMTMFGIPQAKTARTTLSVNLGVSVSALESLMVGYGADWNGREFTSWPSRNERGEIIGIIRRYENGEKKTMRGTSNAGVFAQDGWWKPPGDLWIVEGGSDTAACIGNGIAAIGRPSNIGGAKVIAAMIRRRAERKRIVVFGENDRKETCPAKCGKHCLACWPGLHGARKVAFELADMLKRSVGLQMPKGKDVRDDLKLTGQ